MFQDWMEGKGAFARDNRFLVGNYNQINIFKYSSQECKQVYEMLMQYKETYSNYIFALTMGLRKNNSDVIYYCRLCAKYL